jgi:pyridine nucleotide-disulfide oxidoreductase family protein
VTKRIILAGGGHAHLAVLADWARTPLPGTEKVLVTPARHTAYSGMVPGWMAGIYRLEDCLIDLAPLAEQAGARLVFDAVTGLDAGGQLLTLASGDTLSFDLLSLATGGEADLSSLAVLGERLLPVKPVEQFLAGWTAIAQFTGPLSLAVVGGGAAGVEIALAAARALRQRSASIALVCPYEGFLPGHHERVRGKALGALGRSGVTVHFAQAAGAPGGLQLSDGSFLAADHVIAATGSRAPGWLAQSGLACTPAGFAAVGADLASTSHPAIMAAGDIVERIDRKLPRSGVHAVKAGPVLAANIRARLGQGTLREYQPRRRTLYLMATGDRRAIASWGGLCVAGSLVWWLKDRIDRGFVARHRRSPPPSQGA